MTQKVVADSLWVIRKFPGDFQLEHTGQPNHADSVPLNRRLYTGVWDWTEKAPMLGPTDIPPTRVFGHCSYNVPSFPHLQKGYLFWKDMSLISASVKKKKKSLRK